MSRHASAPARLLVLGVDGGDQLGPALEAADGLSAPEVEVRTLRDPTSTSRIETRLQNADCVLLAEDVYHCVTPALKRGPPAVLLVEEFSTTALDRGVEMDVEAFLPREAVTDAPDLVADRVSELVNGDDATHPASVRPKKHGDPPEHGAIIVHDAETGRLVDATPAFCELVGYNRETVLELGTDGLDAGGEGTTRPRADAVVTALRATGRVEPFEWGVRTADGEQRRLEVTPTQATIDGRRRHLSVVRDLTERRDLKRNYRTVFDTVAAAVSLHAPGDPQILDANRTLCKLVGYDRETLVGMDSREVTADQPGYDADRIAQLHEEAVESERPVKTQWPLETAEGDIRWLDLTLTTATLHDELRVVVTGRDITERKRREREYEQIFNGVNDAVAVHDPDTGEMVDVNATMCELTGYDRETLLNRGAEGLLVDHPDADIAPERVPEIIDRVTAGEEIAPYEQVIQTSTGERVWVEVNPTQATVGGDARFLAISRDVTARKRREREFEQIFNAIEDPITIHDPETAEHLRVNDGFCELLGYSHEQIKELGIEGYSLTEEGYTLERAREFVRSVIDSDEPKEMEWVVKTSEGERRWLQVKGTTAEIGGEVRFVSIDRDVTERRRREREYEQIFDGVNDAIAVHDPETGEILDVNDSYVELFGHDRDRILEKGIDGLSATEEGYTADRARALIREVAATGEDQTVEWRIRTADDERRTVESSLTVAEVGGNRRVLSMIRDVTERRRREREYEQIFDGVNDAITIHDPDTAEMLAVNETFCEMVGYDRETVLDMKISEFSHDDMGYTTERGRAFIQNIGESGEPDQTEWALETADGKTRWVEVHGGIAEIDGQRRFVAIDRDITEAKRREREFEQIFNGVNDAITVHHPETAEIIRANEPYLELLGYDSVKRLRELGIDGLSATEEGFTAEAGKQLIREAGQRATPTTVEWRAERADGERLWLEATLTPGEVGGEPRVLSIQRDVTERKRREQQLAVFNRVLRHNLRNRVDVIRSHAETLRDRTDGEHAAQIVENADRLATLGARIRDADRLLRRDARPRHIDLAETVRNVVDDVTEGDEESSVTVQTALPAELTVQTDEEALQVVLRSALANAVEYAETTVKIVIARTDANGATISIDDDGPGIPASELEALEAGTESMLQHSRGLGLWRIQWGTELLNGRLSFDVEDGTTITVRLPGQSMESPE
jgi:PAS domain S-box-containing protein